MHNPATLADLVGIISATLLALLLAAAGVAHLATLRRGFRIVVPDWATRLLRTDNLGGPMPDGFVLAAISARENPLDAFVSNRYAGLDDLPAGAVVGTSSLRREATLRARYPQLTIRSLRGNLDTRLKKLDAGEYDAIILAAAGLIRLGLENRIRTVLTAEQSLPAPGQGALGIELVAGDEAMAAVAAPLNDSDTAHCVRAERAMSRALGGSCQVPLGGYAIIDGGQLWLRGFVASVDGSQWVAGEVRGDPADDEALGLRLAEMLRAQGAEAILAGLACHG